MIGGIIGFLVLVADIWAIVNIVQSGESAAMKVLWIALVLLMPVLGLAVWYFAGPKST